ncbi:MAG: DUF2309 domain-containing protein [Alicyclobacillus sp.]|nr:DUF2309 domain-containing protein [Alicyclobacillus sp.]
MSQREQHSTHGHAHRVQTGGPKATREPVAATGSNVQTLSHPDWQELVRNSADAIAPLWPIATFIARHPWPELEHHPYAEVAHWLRDAQGIHLHPPASVVESAVANGEVAPHHLTRRLNAWLDAQPVPMPRDAAERACLALLWTFQTDLPPASATAEALADTLLQDSGAHARWQEATHPTRTRWTVTPLSKRLDGAAKAQSQDRDVRERRGASARGLAHELDVQTIRFCKLFFDDGQASWPLPGREAGFYAAWRQLTPLQPGLPRRVRQQIDHWPKTPADALERALVALDVPAADWEGYLRAHLLALPGWAGWALWQSRGAGREPSLLLEYLAVRVSLEWALCADHLDTRGGEPLRGAVRDADTSRRQADARRFAAQLIATWLRDGGVRAEDWSAMTADSQVACLDWLRRFVETDRWLLWLEAWEDAQADQLRAAIAETRPEDGPSRRGGLERTLAKTTDAVREPAKGGAKGAAGAADRPAAQLLLCIDVRSAIFRHYLEAAGPFETYGCAGFFNLPIRTRGLDSDYAHPACPPIVHPVVEVAETLATDGRDYRRRRNGARIVAEMFKKAKHSALVSLALPELSGPWLGVHTLFRTVLPARTGRWMRAFNRAASDKPATELSLRRPHEPQETHSEVSGLPIGMTTEEMVDIAAGLFQSIGLSEFAPLVVICGHEGESTNNPHASSLDCGACGGAAGQYNARAFAAMCNLPEVREGLAEAGFVIPGETVFAAAEHITTTDALRWLDVPPLPPAARSAFRSLEDVLLEVRHAANQARIAQLPVVQPRIRPFDEADRRAADWSEVRPEWGLAGNAAFVIGRRQLTARFPLDGRVFLHDYDWRMDLHGDRLASIVAGPVTVGQWINLQYLASTTAPHIHGSGSKTTQTVTGGVGVMQGNGSDLLPGLPWQSVAASDDALFHRPLRLLVVMEVPDEAVTQLLERDAAFRQKVQNGWLRLASVNPVTGEWRDWGAAASSVSLVTAG